jgi:AcrR family transcriptional regulator
MLSGEMPKLTGEQLRDRRAGIVRAARRVFAQYGYEGATVVRLEQATGLSRGAIFYYFADKRELFVAVALDLNARFVDLIVQRGIDEAVRSMAEEDAELLWVMFEVQARLRHDKEFERRLAARTREGGLLLEWFEAQQAAGHFRGDIAASELARYVTFVLNGIALQVAIGDSVDASATLDLLHGGLGP